MSTASLDEILSGRVEATLDEMAEAHADLEETIDRLESEYGEAALAVLACELEDSDGKGERLADAKRAAVEIWRRAEAARTNMRFLRDAMALKLLAKAYERVPILSAEYDELTERRNARYRIFVSLAAQAAVLFEEFRDDITRDDVPALYVSTDTIYPGFEDLYRSEVERHRMESPLKDPLWNVRMRRITEEIGTLVGNAADADKAVSVYLENRTSIGPARGSKVIDLTAWRRATGQGRLKSSDSPGK